MSNKKNPMPEVKKVSKAQEEKYIAKYKKIVEEAMVDLCLDYEIIGYMALNIGGVKVVGDIHPAVGFTDYKAIYINAVYANAWNLGKEHIKFLIAHEVFHILTLTRGRQGNRNHKVWNAAADYAINQILVDDEEIINHKSKSVGIFIEGGCLDDKYRGMSAEDIYDILVKEIRESFKKWKKKNQLLQNDNDNKLLDLSDIADILDDLLDDVRGIGDSGSGIAENPNESEDINGKGNQPSDNDGDPQTGGDEESQDGKYGPGKGKFKLDEHLDLDSPEIQEDLREATMRVQSILESAKMEGKLSSGMKRLINSLPKVKENWRYNLEKYIKSFKKAESTWKRPNKRFAAAGFYLPTRYDTPDLNVAIGIDTSGSIDDKMLEKFFGHILKIVKSFKTFEIQVFCWSTVAHKGTYRKLTEKNYQNFNPMEEGYLESFGGTVAQSGFDYVKTLKDKPDCYILFTDGYFEDEIKNFDQSIPVVFAIRKEDNENFQIPKGLHRAKRIKVED